MLEQLCGIILEAVEEELENRVIEVYKKLFAKELFMTFTGFDEITERYSNVARLIEEVIVGFTEDLRGFRCTDEQANGLATRIWQKLKTTYEEEAQ